MVGNPSVVGQLSPPVVMNMRSPDYRVSYANGFTFSFSPIDFMITFLADIPMAGASVAQEEAAIRMTLPALKILNEHLTKIVRAFEETNGTIKVIQRSRPTDDQVNTVLKTLSDNQLVE